jgi:hypothetical protein
VGSTFSCNNPVYPGFFLDLFSSTDTYFPTHREYFSMGDTMDIKELATILDSQQKIMLQTLIKNNDTTIFRTCHKQIHANADLMVLAAKNLEDHNLITKTRRDSCKPGQTDQILQHYELTALGKTVCYEARIH